VPLSIEGAKPVLPIAQIQSNRYPTALVLFPHKAKSLSERSRIQRPSPSHLIWFGVPFRSNDTNRADLQQRLQRVGSPTMFHDATAYNAI
jgi:hypothetical protein